MAGNASRVGLLHYSAPPVIGGVESVMQTHARLFAEAGYHTAFLAGRGDQAAMPPGTEFIHVPEVDSQHPRIVAVSRELEDGRVPAAFDELVQRSVESLAPALERIDVLIVHNVFTKHFNLPLTAALFRLLEQGAVRRCVAWCHDITWTSPNSRSKMHAGYPWDLLRTYRPDIEYVTISQERQKELGTLFGISPEQIQIIYNGVEPRELLALSDDGLLLIDRLNLWESNLNLLMPVRITQAKNIELALRVVAALKERGLRTKLVVTGPPDPHDPQNMKYFQSLLNLREELGVIAELRFVYESNAHHGEPLIVDIPVVADLFRVSDALFMPSHREGFGMPILEAGLAGMPVFCSDHIPAANEIGGPDVTRFAPEAEPAQIANLITKRLENSPVFQLRRRVRQSLTWRSIFLREILPLVKEGAA